MIAISVPVVKRLSGARGMAFPQPGPVPRVTGQAVVSKREIDLPAHPAGIRKLQETDLAGFNRIRAPGIR
jgi:hypothetical protein